MKKSIVINTTHTTHLPNFSMNLQRDYGSKMLDNFERMLIRAVRIREHDRISLEDMLYDCVEEFADYIINIEDQEGREVKIIDSALIDKLGYYKEGNELYLSVINLSDDELERSLRYIIQRLIDNLEDEEDED